jgi:hypothetical protein
MLRRRVDRLLRSRDSIGGGQGTRIGQESARTQLLLGLGTRSARAPGLDRVVCDRRAQRRVAERLKLLRLPSVIRGLAAERRIAAPTVIGTWCCRAKDRMTSREV